MTAVQTLDAAALIAADILRELAHSLNQAPEEIAPDRPFVDLGADSLILAEALREINQRYGVSLPIGEIYEKVNTITKLAKFIHRHGNGAARASGSAAGRLEPSAPRPTPAPPADPSRPAQPPPASISAPDLPGVARILHYQLELMDRQLALLSAGRGGAVPESPVEIAAEAPIMPSASAPSDPAPAAPVDSDRFQAFAIALAPDARAADEQKVRRIKALSRRAAEKAPRSKELAQAYRRVLADNRVSAGFRPLLKELVYPILADRAEGARVTDIDGNEYLDFTCGFGVHLFGHSPGFVTEAIRQQVERGMPIGPQSPIAGKVAGLICEMTGHERVVFCNSGTEATMTAARLARAKCGRDRIVQFRNSYHGTFDGFLARSPVGGGDARPASLGTPASLVADTLVLDYGTEAALKVIEDRAGEIAAVLVEPVQSRMPDLQPKEFLHALRRLTETHGIALIFDEVITGFRCAPGGAQEYFGVGADLCTYGKIIGGGMPIGAVAGKAAYLDGIDGGWWQYGDESRPEATTIFFAGTFSKHPLTMAASLAVLEEMKAHGRDLCQRLNRDTARLAERLNGVFAEEGAEVRVEQFSSLFRFAAKGNLDLFFYSLLAEGIYIWEGRNCFVSAAHEAADLDRLVEIVRKVCRDLLPHHLMPRHPSTPGAAEVAARPLADAQQRFRRLARSGSEGEIACNICFGFLFEGPLDADRLERAVISTCRAEAALWSRFDLDRGTQSFSTAPASDLFERIAVAEPLNAATAPAWLGDEQNLPLDPAAGRNFRARLFVPTTGEGALLSLTLHHLACDGWGLNVLLQKIARAYNGEAEGAETSYGAWLDHERDYRQSERYRHDREFWHRTVDQIVERERNDKHNFVERERNDKHNFVERERNDKPDFTERARRLRSGPVAARPGARASLTLDAAVTKRLQGAARQEGTTAFTWLLANFQLFLERICQGRAPVIGIPFANRTGRLTGIVGNCVNLVALPPGEKPAEGPRSFAAALQYCRQRMSDLLTHSRFPYLEACALYRDRSPERGETPIAVTFNVEPIAALPAFGEVTPSLIAPQNHWIEFDLMTNCFLLEAELRIELDYNRELFGEDEVYGFLYLLAKLIENHSASAEEERPGEREEMPAPAA